MSATTGQTLPFPVGLLGELQERGFIPDDGGEWFDLPVGELATVRVAFDDGTVIVYALTDRGVLLWDVTLSDGTPAGVITGVIDLAVVDVRAGELAED